MTIDVKGNSGCNISIIEEDNVLYIEKSTTDKKYINRLELQANKQQKAKTTNIIDVPKIHVTHKDPNYFVMKMDYVYGKNFVDFMQCSSFVEIDNFINAITNYIDDEISCSQLKEIPSKIFIDKLSSIITNSNYNTFVNNYPEYFNDIFNQSLDVFNSIDNIIIPVNVCHGDLTFSNIIFSNNKYYLIDFLDSFIETPLQDIVKIRQDSSLYWSLQMYDKPLDIIRMKTVFNYIDNKINEVYNKYDFYNKYYDILQLINILRIVPYIKSDKVAKYLIITLEKILLKFKHE